MPEGDTVHKLATYLASELTGRTLVDGRARIPGEIELDACRVTNVYAHGKHLFIELDAKRLLRCHLGMHGSWHAYGSNERWQRPKRMASVVLHTGERVYVCFNAKQVEMMRCHGVRRHTLNVALGPDLLSDPVEFAQIRARVHALHDHSTPVADLLLDQRVASGIGNVYKSEVLFLEGLHPNTRVSDVSDEHLQDVYQIASQLLRQNTRDGPRITRRAHDAAGRLWVYGRTGQLCLRCDERIRAARLGKHQRSTFWCPSCQPELAGFAATQPK